MYEYTPPHTNTAAKLVLFFLLVIALGTFICGSLVPAYRGAVQTAALFLAMGAILFCTRFVMTGYAYEIAAEGNDGPDLIITEIRGNKRTVVCRLRIRGAKLLPASAEKPRGNCYNYAPGFLPEGVTYFLPAPEEAEAYSVACVRFLPDEKMKALMRRCGAQADPE